MDETENAVKMLMVWLLISNFYSTISSEAENIVKRLQDGPGQKSSVKRNRILKKIRTFTRNFLSKIISCFSSRESQFILLDNTNITQLVICMSIHRKVEATAEECPLPNLSVSLSKFGISDLDWTPTKTMGFPV